MINTEISIETEIANQNQVLLSGDHNRLHFIIVVELSSQFFLKIAFL